ncbi:type VII secretion target [Mycobacterium botniense]|uniref:ESX-1 secretion-associated protein n=1 Tax=Mycobacterium botniense TaxID=84962 RepID=A0A7I9XUR7_9MYCO|nr:type VII secretion target [Mycobacterium botniense]GFG73047.1 hypothetical protein MBOT_04120 [Mycobacterium botniense]
MGQPDRTAIDVGALRALANRFDTTAQMLDEAARNQSAGLVFAGATAGRAHRARGAELRAALERLAAEVSRWSHTTAVIADALRATADRYTHTELRVAARID